MVFVKRYPARCTEHPKPRDDRAPGRAVDRGCMDKLRQRYQDERTLVKTKEVVCFLAMFEATERLPAPNDE
jgi:hypothetical protein